MMSNDIIQYHYHGHLGRMDICILTCPLVRCHWHGPVNKGQRQYNCRYLHRNGYECLFWHGTINLLYTGSGKVSVVMPVSLEAAVKAFFQLSTA